MVIVKDFNNIEIEVNSNDLEFTLFCCIDNLIIETPEIFNIPLIEDIWITNDFAYIDTVKLDNIIKEIGILTQEYLLNAKIFAYKKIIIKDAINTNDELEHFINILNSFCNFFLWLIKDNKASVTEAFLVWAFVNSKYSSNISHKINEDKSDVFSLDEIQFISSFFINVLNNNRPQYILPNEPPIDKKAKSNKIFRAIYLIENIRSCIDLSLKISNMCTVFEMFFSTGGTEISYKLAERIAYFISSDPEQRLVIYKIIKNAYDIRSKLSHGDVVKEELYKNLQETAEICDNILRLTMYSLFNYDDVREILLKDSEDGKSKYFEKLIFGVESSPLYSKSSDFIFIIEV